MKTSTPRRGTPLPKIGTRFGSRIVISYGIPRHYSPRVVMRCDCGREDETALKNVLEGRANLCRSCTRKVKPDELPPVGTRYGRRVVAGYPPRWPRQIRVLMRCDCGRTDETNLSLVREGRADQCLACINRK